MVRLSITVLLWLPKITVYPLQAQYASLFIEEHTGDISIPKEFTFDSIDLSFRTGDVDCASMARDARLLHELGGYAPAALKAFDMFPRTANVETVCLLYRQKKTIFPCRVRRRTRTRKKINNSILLAQKRSIRNGRLYFLQDCFG